MKSEAHHPPLRVIVAGIGTDVGKTLCAAIIAKALQADYWKPVQCGSMESSDKMRVATLIDDPSLKCHQEAFCLKAPASPHYAAQLEGKKITLDDLGLPSTKRPLIIECAGGVLAPINKELLQADAFKMFDFAWILVSRHYLGSINHTLLSIDALRSRGCRLAGIIFNGTDKPSGEPVILDYAKTPLIGRLQEEPGFNQFKQATTLTKRYAEQWKPQLLKTLQLI